MTDPYRWRLTCQRCGVTTTCDLDAKVDGVPVQNWFVQRGRLCTPCFKAHPQVGGYREVAAYRSTDPRTSEAGGHDVAIRSGSQRHKLLMAYADGSDLTADEAMRKAEISPRSCYWKRVSELLAYGLLEDIDEERLGESGSMQRVNRITAAGKERLPPTEEKP
ncbi:MAG: hypothetical protein NVS3B1_06170 [Marmoricola sp.]